jgi:hypothetical protein
VHRSLKLLLPAAFLSLPGILAAQAAAPPATGAGQARPGQAGQAGQTGQAGQGAGQAGQPTQRFNFPTPLFQQPNVGQTLNLNRDQMGRLTDLNQRLQTRFQDEFNRAAGATGRDRDTNLQNLQGRFNTEFMQGARGVFNEQQMTRFQQLQLQSQGPSALMNPDVARRLNLSDEQRARLRELDTQFRRQMNEFSGPDASRREGFRNRWETFQRDSNSRLNSLLDENQRRTWSEMTGERFNFGPPAAPGTGTGGTTPPRP